MRPFGIGEPRRQLRRTLGIGNGNAPRIADDGIDTPVVGAVARLGRRERSDGRLVEETHHARYRILVAGPPQAGTARCPARASRTHPRPRPAARPRPRQGRCMRTPGLDWSSRRERPRSPSTSNSGVRRERFPPSLVGAGFVKNLCRLSLRLPDGLIKGAGKRADRRPATATPTRQGPTVPIVSAACAKRLPTPKARCAAALGGSLSQPSMPIDRPGVTVVRRDHVQGQLEPRIGSIEIIEAVLLGIEHRLKLMAVAIQHVPIQRTGRLGVRSTPGRRVERPLPARGTLAGRRDVGPPRRALSDPRRRARDRSQSAALSRAACS